MVKQKDTELDQLEDDAGLFLSRIVNGLPLAVFCKDYGDGSGRLVAWNSRAEELWNIAAKDIVWKTDSDFFPKEQADFFRQTDLNTLNSGETVYVPEERADSPKKGIRYVRTWKVPIDGRYLLGVSQDITEQKQLESELERQKAISFHTAKLASLGEVAGGIAHEINNPLAVIMGLVHKLDRLFQTDRLTKDESKNLIGKVQKTVMRIQSIVDGLRKFSRDGSQDQRAPTIVSSIVADAVEFVSESFKRDHVELQTELGALGDHAVLATGVQLSQVLVNLLNNARWEVSKLGAPNPWVRVELMAQGSSIQIRVIDSGLGIPLDVQNKLFQPFFTTKGVGTGTGLGLSISKGIIEDHGGSLRLDPNNKNTVFVIELPIQDIRKAV